MWHESWGGLPEDDFFNALDPYLVDVKSNFQTETYTADQAVGTLNQEWANKLGLYTSTVIAMGTFDAHAGAVGAGVQPNTLVKVMGTSTCDMLISESSTLGTTTVAGICGQVDGSITPEFVGLEAGQSAFGDVLAWFKNVLLQPNIQLIKKLS